MGAEKKVSDAKAASLALTALVLEALYVVVGVNWYYKGHLVMCTCEFSVDPNSWCSRPSQSFPDFSNCSIREAEYESMHRFDLWWNSMFLTDDKRRETLAGIVTVIYAAFLGFVAAVLKDWWLPSK